MYGANGGGPPGYEQHVARDSAAAAVVDSDGLHMHNSCASICVDKTCM